VSDERTSPLVYALAGILFLESAAVGVATAYLIVELLIDQPGSYVGALFLTALTAIATVWAALMGIHTLRGSPWIRGSAVVWQVLQIAVAVGSFQDPFSRPDIAWLLLIPAIAVMVLLFTKPVIAATTRPE
jgi:hypothetical protein